MGNELRGNIVGIDRRGPEGLMDADSVTAGGTGNLLGDRAPTVTGNSLCGNEVNLVVDSRLESSDGGSNTIREDA